MRKFFAFMLMAIVLTMTLSTCRHLGTPDDITLKIICTSDVHGAIFPYDLIMDKPVEYSLAQVYSYVEQERSNSGQQVVLLDNGDILQGDPLIYYYNFHKPEAMHIVAQTMNYMSYDAATVGNHDIEPGPEVYDKVKSEFVFPWLAANAVVKATGEPYFQPYTIIEKSGIKIAVLGMITPAIPRWLPDFTWEGMVFEDMIVAARHWVEVIQTEEKPDILIGLFHAGVDYTYANQEATTPFNENASLLVAEQIPGFDVIFVGHDHRGWNKTVSNNFGGEVLILGTLANARNAAAATIQMTYNSSLKSFEKTISGDIVDMRDYEPHSGFIEHFNPAFKEASAFVARPIGKLTAPLSTRPVLFGDAAFTDLMHRVQLKLTNADLSFTSSQSFDLTIPEGALYVRDMFKFQRYENLLYAMTLTGQEVKDYLEFSYGLWFNQMNSATDHLLRFSTDSDGNLIRRGSGDQVSLAHPFWNLDSAEGIKYTVDVSQPVGNRIHITSFLNGTPFHLNHTYLVAINSYRGSGGGDHLTIGANIPRGQLKNRVQFSTEKDLRWLSIDYIEKKDSITPTANNNWKIVPESWWKTASDKDFGLVFGSR
jgi:2',3'-cyclic-nucleotide 2'-phosphodiesterase / 3'-nucleotidase